MTKDDWDLPPVGLPDSFLDSLDEDDGPRGTEHVNMLNQSIDQPIVWTYLIAPCVYLIENLMDWLIDWLTMCLQYCIFRNRPETFLSVGVITKTGEINWACPCLGNLTYGPCALPFQEAFSCFHFSQADPKGSDCIDKFRAMSECMHKFPTLYPNDKDGDENDDEDDAFATMDKAEHQAQREENAKQFQSPASKTS